MTREELITLAKRIVNCERTEEEIDQMCIIFNNNVTQPEGIHLFYYPENYNKKNGNIADYNPTIEEVVDKAISLYR